jgi:hypothetical protein
MGSSGIYIADLSSLPTLRRQKSSPWLGWAGPHEGRHQGAHFGRDGCELEKLDIGGEGETSS